MYSWLSCPDPYGDLKARLLDDHSALSVYRAYLSSAGRPVVLCHAVYGNEVYEAVAILLFGHRFRQNRKFTFAHTLFWHLWSDRCDVVELYDRNWHFVFRDPDPVYLPLNTLKILAGPLVVSLLIIALEPWLAGAHPFLVHSSYLLFTLLMMEWVYR